MDITHSSFQNGGEIDYRAAYKINMNPLGMKCEGRLSLRKNGQQYQFYLEPYSPVNHYHHYPRVELILYETPSLQDAVDWGNREIQKDPLLFDTYEGKRVPADRIEVDVNV